MLPLVGCEGNRTIVPLHQKPNLGGDKGSARNSSAERDHNSRLSLRIANPSIHLIGKCYVLHESWPTDAPVRSLTLACQWFLYQLCIYSEHIYWKTPMWFSITKAQQAR